MSLRQAFRSRFKSVEKEPSPETDGENTNNKQENVSKKESSTGPSPAAEWSPPPESQALEASVYPEGMEKSVYEIQMVQLQEQLVAAMIENQNLCTELVEFRENHRVEGILRDLDYEKQRNQQLSKELEAMAIRAMSDKDDSGNWVDVAQEVTEETDLQKQDPRSQMSLYCRMKESLVSWFCELLSDFTEDPEPEIREKKHTDQLTVKTLKENIKRFSGGTKPFYTIGKGVHGLFTWKYPTFTLIVFMIYMYAVWQGWLLPLLLLLGIMRLTGNYMKHRGWNINIHFLIETEEEDTSEEGPQDLKVSDKFNLVLQVATKVQNFLGDAADNLEKLKNLLTWEHPQATAQLLVSLVIGFFLSCFLPGTTLFTIAGLYLGFKMFVLEYMYTRFPRFKYRHDSVYKIWMELPTDADTHKKQTRKALNRHLLSPSHSGGFSDQATTGSDVSDVDKTFCDIFNIPYSEKPMKGWETGRRCTCIDRDKSLTSAFKNGRLYLTTSFLCFERYKYPSPKNIILPLTDITDITKAKPFTWIPGGGMSLEIACKGFEKPHLFGAILNRDEMYSSIMAHAVSANMPWARVTPEPESKGQNAGAEGSEASKDVKAEGQGHSLTFRMSDLQDNDDPDFDLMGGFG